MSEEDGEKFSHGGPGGSILKLGTQWHYRKMPPGWPFDALLLPRLLAGALQESSGMPGSLRAAYYGRMRRTLDPLTTQTMVRRPFFAQV